MRSRHSFTARTFGSFTAADDKTSTKLDLGLVIAYNLKAIPDPKQGEYFIDKPFDKE